MYKQSPDELMNAIDAFMIERNWSKVACAKCGKMYHVKSTNDTPGFCGRGACGDGRAFLQLSKRKRPISPEQTYDHLARCFAGADLKIVPGMNVAGTHGETDLIVAGVQIFDELIHQGGAACTDQMFIGQPSVRMQFQNRVADEDGISTSFVNVCTEKTHQTFGGHLHVVDQWLEALSSLGLHMKDFAIIVRTSEGNWGTGPFTAVEIFFVYAGLELGDAAYMFVPTRHNSSLPISDIGFGLERIVWAINKTPRYYDLLMPGSAALPREACDALRTITLLALCGVQPRNKGPGLQFRRLVKILSDRYGNIDSHALIKYYIDYWSCFLKESLPTDSVHNVINLEIDRFLNLKICKARNLPPPREETTEEYFRRLVYTMGMDAQELRQLIQLCRS